MGTNYYHHRDVCECCGRSRGSRAEGEGRNVIKTFRLSDCDLHDSGLRTMPSSSVAQVRHTVALPVCCPISKNPREGSNLTIVYQPSGSVLEVYSVVAVVKLFRGGFPGAGKYRAERNMEGMIDLLAQMAADAVGVPVRVQADLVLDAGGMRITTRATPS